MDDFNVSLVGSGEANHKNESVAKEELPVPVPVPVQPDVRDSNNTMYEAIEELDRANVKLGLKSQQSDKTLQEQEPSRRNRLGNFVAQLSKLFSRRSAISSSDVTIVSS